MPRSAVHARRVVATSQPLAAQAGLAMMQQGGNAIDAAVAAAAALTVVEPTSNGIGGDAFALVWDGDTLHGLNASGRSPAAWTPDRFAGRSRMPVFGGDAVTVPGAVSAWSALHARFGSLPFDTLLTPAIDYAERGYPVGPVTALAWARAADRYREVLEAPTLAAFADTFLHGGTAPHAGQRVTLPGHADTLRGLAASHGAAMYDGPIAQAIADAVQRAGGALTADDLAAHAPEWVAPLSVPFRGLTVHELPPNGQGIAALLALGVLDRGSDSADTHTEIEAMKLALAAAYGVIADDQANAAAALIDPPMLDRLAAALPEAAAPIPVPPQADHGTVYLCAADEQGRMVSLIQSNYMGFGSGVVVPGLGIALQNRGAGFNLIAGHPNQAGPRKRPYHTIIPGFATRDDQPLLAFGVMGGHHQPQGHVQLLRRLLDDGLDPQAALDAPRWHLGEDAVLYTEAGFDADTIKHLQAHGHAPTINAPTHHFGGGQVIQRLDSGLFAAGSDRRKEGCAAGD